jgi:hypothetical protein
MTPGNRHPKHNHARKYTLMITSATVSSIQLLTADLPPLAMPFAQYLMQRSIDINQYGRAAALGVFREILPVIHLGRLEGALATIQDIGDSGNRTQKAMDIAQAAWMAIGRDRGPATIAFGYVNAVRKLCDADAGVTMH